MTIRILAALLATVALAACGVDGTPQSGGSSAAPSAQQEPTKDAPKSEPESSKGEEKKAN